MRILIGRELSQASNGISVTLHLLLLKFMQFMLQMLMLQGKKI